ncbi:unannotated protein [freshwater metagenome]|uniref:Unannotated protein n=1 Tax=freshwater metagenome TaxID=449393 RepID=A0A6J7FCB2_9ZZZZ|nr:hypothetical protein [Actinomycetota bacterium]
MRRTTPDPELDALERRAHAIGERIGAPRAAYPPFGTRLDAGYPNVDRRDGAWVWEVHERGRLLEHRTTRDEDEILYWIFVDVTRWMGQEWARGRPSYAPDTRVTWAGRILELLADLEPRWLERFLREEDSWLSTVRWPDGPPDPYGGSWARRVRRRLRGPRSPPG